MSNIEELTKQSAENTTTINKLRNENYLLTINQPFDYIILNFLKSLGLDYNALKAEIDASETANRTQINQLCKANGEIERQLLDQQAISESKTAGLTIQGVGVVNVDGDLVTIKCNSCSTEFSKHLRNIIDLRGHSVLEDVLGARSETEFYEKVMRYNSDRFKLECPKCFRTNIVYARRQF